MKKNLAVKLLIGAVIVLLLILSKILGLDNYLSLAFLKEQHTTLLTLYNDKPIVILSLYFFLYITVTALSLPGAAIMTLAGGAIFGLVTGTIVVSFASTIGATLACFAARYLLRDWVQKKFGDKLEKINRGMEKEGGFYLFSLRLVPLFPFFIINLVMGLTTIRLTTYYWVSQLGMLPATIVYINAGKELGKINNLSGILAPGLIAAFVMLGLLPIVTKKILSFYTEKKQTVPNGKI